MLINLLKKNVKVHTFVDRMKARGIEIKPNERFEYVIVKRYPYKYDTRGRKEELSIGDKMELIDVAIKENLEIDLDHYMKNSINGQLARLIAYHEMFHVEAEPDELAVAETKIYDNACKYIENYCKQYYSNYKSVGTVYKTIFNKTNSTTRKNLKKYDGFTANLLTSNIDEEIDIWFEKYAEKNAESKIKEIKKRKSYGETKLLEELNDYVKENPNKEKNKAKKEKFYYLEKIYCDNKLVKSLYNKRLDTHKKHMNILRDKLKSKKHVLLNIFNFHNGHINKIINELKSIVNIPDDYYKPTYGEIESKLDNLDNSNLDNDINLDNLDNSNLDNTIKLDKSNKLEKTNKTNKTNKLDDLENLDDHENEKDKINIELKIKTENIINEYKLDKKIISYSEKLFQDKEKINDLNIIKDIYNEMHSSFMFIKKTESLINALKNYRNNLINFIDTPENIEEVKKNDINNCLDNVMKLQNL